MLYFLSKLISIYFPKREELLFRIVFALPNDSNNGFESNICVSILRPVRLAVDPHTVDKNCKIFFVASVLPAPDSPTKLSEEDHQMIVEGGKSIKGLPEISTD